MILANPQVRHKIKGWDLNVSYDFSASAGSGALRAALCKTIGRSTLTTSWDHSAQEAGVDTYRWVNIWLRRQESNIHRWVTIRLRRSKEWVA